MAGICNCCRRDFLAMSGGGFGALAFSALRQLEAASPSAAAEHSAAPPIIDPLAPFAPRPPHFAPRAKSVIFIYLVGGPSHVDSFDYKPTLQKLAGKPVPASVRKAVEASKHANVFRDCKDELLASPFKFSQHGQSGMWVSELWPNVARHVDDLCFIHSLQSESNNHAPSSYAMHTGDVRPGKASLGSWVTYGLGSENQDLPGYVALFDAGPLGGAANYSNGFLPAAFQPTRLRDVGIPALDLTPPADLAAGQRASLDLLRELNLKHRAAHASGTVPFSGALGRKGDCPPLPVDRTVEELDARIASYELAYRMQSAALEVGGLEHETPATHRLYGIDQKEERLVHFARKCLLARRLVERGVRFVQVYDMPDKDGWDAHSDLHGNHEPRARWTDRPIAALLADLKQRGLLESTLVICGSEFGRTPMMQGNNGRQHNAAGFTIWLAGGGVQPGQQIGQTDEIGLMAIDRPTSFHDLHATILAALGLRCDDLFFEVNGRSERLTGVAGSAKVIEGILS